MNWIRSIMIYVCRVSRLLSSSSKFMKKKKKRPHRHFDRVVACTVAGWVQCYGYSRTESCVQHVYLRLTTLSHASSNTQYLMYCLHHKLHTLAAGSFWKRRRQQNVEALPKLCSSHSFASNDSDIYTYSYIYTHRPDSNRSSAVARRTRNEETHTIYTYLPMLSI
jgi:hypothetical protein